jgi:hypothetical protein
LVDVQTLVVIATVVQTAVISVTLIVFIFQFRSQEKAIKEASYQGLMGRYNDLVSMLVEKPELALPLLSIASPELSAEHATKEDAATFGYLMLAYGIIEEAYLLYERKWIDQDNWLQWAAFLERLARHPRFRHIHRMTAGTFDSGFEDYITKNILKDQKEESTGNIRT